MLRSPTAGSSLHPEQHAAFTYFLGNTVASRRLVLPVAFLIKTPIGTILLIAMGAGALVAKRRHTCARSHLLLGFRCCTFWRR